MLFSLWQYLSIAYNANFSELSKWYRPPMGSVRTLDQPIGAKHRRSNKLDSAEIAGQLLALLPARWDAGATYSLFCTRTYQVYWDRHRRFFSRTGRNAGIKISLLKATAMAQESPSLLQAHGEGRNQQPWKQYWPDCISASCIKMSHSHKPDPLSQICLPKVWPRQITPWQAFN